MWWYWCVDGSRNLVCIGGDIITQWWWNVEKDGVVACTTTKFKK